MRGTIKSTVILFFFCICMPGVAQSAKTADEVVSEARALYDAPFTRDLAGFDCAIQFDWKSHFASMVGAIPPTAIPTIERLQSIQHRASTDHTHATVSSTPKTPDFGDAAQAATLEQVLIAMASSGLNSWLPSSTNGLLPLGTTDYTDEKLPSGYKLVMKGKEVAGTLLLGADMRITSGVMQLPQPLRFTTEFESGPRGYLLSSVDTDTGSGGNVKFAYAYQSVEGFQIPAQVRSRPRQQGCGSSA